MKIRGTVIAFPKILPLLLAQTIGAFNDNVVRAFLPAMIAFQFGREMMNQLNFLILILLYIPFVLFAPMAGWMADRFSKRKVVSWVLLSQLIGLTVLALSLKLESLVFTLVGFFLLSTQSAFLSPGKKGILKEIVGFASLGKAVGWMEMTTMVGILGGTFVGAWTYGLYETELGGWKSGLYLTIGVSLMALFSWLLFLPTNETEAQDSRPFHPRILYGHMKDLKILFRDKGLRWAALGDAWFWSLAGYLWLVLVELAGEISSDENGISFYYGKWSLVIGIGIMTGSLSSAYLNRGRVELGLTAIGGLGMPVFIFLIYLSSPTSLFFEAACLATGFFGALFFVPLNGSLQNNAENKKRGRVLSASVLLTQASGIAMSLFYGILSNQFGLNAKEGILVVVIPSIVIGILSFYFFFEDFFRAWVHLALKIFYRIRLVGIDNLPESGGVLLVCNHLSYADPVFIGAAFPRKVRYLAHSSLTRSRFLRYLFKVTQTLTVSSEKSFDSIRKSLKSLKEGTPLCVFAEGEISRLGLLLPFMGGSIILAKKGKVPILPVHLDGVWGSIFSMERGVFFRKKPLRIPYRVTVRAGNLIENSCATTQSIRLKVLELGRQSFAERMKYGADAKKALSRQIRGSEKAVFFSSRGEKVEGKDIIQAIGAKNPDLSEEFLKWAEVISENLKGSERNAEIIYANWVRISEMNLWDHDVFIVEKGKGSWTSQWFPWLPMLGCRSMRILESGFLVAKSPEFLEGTDAKRVFGMATERNGLVSINGPDPILGPGDQEIIEQPGMKAGTLGRVLVGFSIRNEAGRVYLHGTKEEEELTMIKRVDSGGFLIPR